MIQEEIYRPFEDVEVWRNVTKGTIVVRLIGETGRLQDQLVQPGQTVELTPRERRIMSQRMVPELNFFETGAMEPVRLLENEKDTAAIQSSPNRLGDEEMAALIKGHWKTFEKRIADVKSPIVIKRMLAMAEDPETGASVRSVQLLREKLEKLEPTEDVIPQLAEYDNMV